MGRRQLPPLAGICLSFGPWRDPLARLAGVFLETLTGGLRC